MYVVLNIVIAIIEDTYMSLRENPVHQDPDAQSCTLETVCLDRIIQHSVLENHEEDQ